MAMCNIWKQCIPKVQLIDDDPEDNKHIALSDQLVNQKWSPKKALYVRTA